MRYQFHGLHFTCKRRECFELVDDRMDFGVKYCTCWLGFLSSRQPTETQSRPLIWVRKDTIRRCRLNRAA